MKKAAIALGVAALGVIAISKGHNVVRYVWLNYGQDPEDWIPMFGQKLPDPISVEWRRPNSTREHLLFLQSYTKNIAAYADLSAEVNRRYCNIRGYRFKAIVDGVTDDPSRNPCWQKVFYIKNEVDASPAAQTVHTTNTEAPIRETHDAMPLPTPDLWIFWLDSDAVVDHPELRIEDIASTMDRRMPTADMGICTSIPFTKNVNTGAMLIKVTPWMRQFLREWWNWPNLRWRQGMCHEQSALDEMMAKDVLGCCSQGKIALFGPTEFNSTYQHGLTMKGKFIQHYRGCSTAKRVAAFENVLSLMPHDMRQ